MTQFEQFLYNHLKFLRRIVQINTLILIIAIPILNHYHITFICGTFYSISIGQLEIADPAIVLQTILLQKQLYFPLILTGLLPVLFALMFGRLFCGWICPFNTFADFFTWINRKLGRKKSHKLKTITNPKPHFFRITLLISLLIVMILGIPFITFISAPGIISSQIADAIFLGYVGWELAFIVLILFAEFILFRRIWCKYLCPIGALISLFRYKHTMQIKFDSEKCNCGSIESACQKTCQFNLNPKKTGVFPYCHNCGDCVAVCQRKYGKALSYTFQQKKCA